LADYPVYVSAGIETSAILAEWLDALGVKLMFGLPATLLLVATLSVALRRTTRLYAEAERREAAEAALRQSERMEALGRLTGGVAHDFNNLLMIVSGAVQRLLHRPRDEQDRRSLDMIVTAARRGEKLTRELLTFSRRQALAPEVIDLSRRLPE